MRLLLLLCAAFGTTLFGWAMWRRFLTDLNRDVIWTKAGDIHRAHAPRRFAVVKALNFALFPVLVLMVGGFWFLVITELMQ